MPVTYSISEKEAETGNVYIQPRYGASNALQGNTGSAPIPAKNSGIVSVTELVRRLHNNDESIYTIYARVENPPQTGLPSFSVEYQISDKTNRILYTLYGASRTVRDQAVFLKTNFDSILKALVRKVGAYDKELGMAIENDGIDLEGVPNLDQVGGSRKKRTARRKTKKQRRRSQSRRHT